MATEVDSGDLLTSKQLNHHIKVNAGPGAGKTHFLVENIKNIIETQKKINKSLNRKVLCITYTNAAVDEIKKRLDGYKHSFEVYTIHGFIIEHIIKPYQTELKKIMNEEFAIKTDSKSIITTQIEGVGLLHGHDKNKIYKFINGKLGTEEELSYSKKIMGEVQVDIKKFYENDILELKKSKQIMDKHEYLIKEYAWTKAKKLTHDEILYFGYKMVRSNSTIAYALRVQFPFIFVDEFQDTNPLQAHLIEYLGAKSTIVGTIGDIAQSIYSFQGAKPGEFRKFNINEETDTYEYEIRGNRRSANNVVSLCNYIRKSDDLEQIGVKQYENETVKQELENKKVVFLVGNTENDNKWINEIVEDGGVVLTRTWAAAFDYIHGISEEQKRTLRKIYNSYYPSPIDIRSEITDHANVTWVRAFKFIHSLWEAYDTKSVGQIINALELYIKKNKIRAGFSIKIVMLLKEILEELFKELDESTLTVDIIGKFNVLMEKEEYREISNLLLGAKDESIFQITCFDEEERDDLKENILKLEWGTSYKLFRDIFSKNSKYMTVHQAKGLEWKKVVVCVEPTKHDKTKVFDMFTNPQIVNETPQDEFTRLFYVACSRAEEELYIHIKNETDEIEVMKEKLEEYCEEKGVDKFFCFC